MLLHLITQSRLIVLNSRDEDSQVPWANLDFRRANAFQVFIRFPTDPGFELPPLNLLRVPQPLQSI